MRRATSSGAVGAALALAGCGTAHLGHAARVRHAATRTASRPARNGPPRRVTARLLSDGSYSSPRVGTVVPGSKLGIRAFGNARDGFALWLSRSGTGLPVMSRDGGRSWHVAGPGFFFPVADGAAAVDQVGAANGHTFFAWGGGGSFVDVTDDDGRHWWGAPLGELVLAVSADTGQLYAVVQNQIDSTSRTLRARAVVYASSDGGRHWRLDPDLGS